MSRVRFIRAPRGDAVVAPPAVGPQSVLGTSQRAAREDHTHEGVHRIVAGDGLSVTPASGLGDVALAVRHWMPPVQTADDLPTSGNQPGDARVTLDQFAVYLWTGAEWQRITARHWLAPVQRAADLPPTGGEVGDARVVLDESA